MKPTSLHGFESAIKAFYDFQRQFKTSVLEISTSRKCYEDPETLSNYDTISICSSLADYSKYCLAFELYPEHLFFKLLLSLKNSPDVGR